VEKRRAVRLGMLANFQFSIDSKPADVFDGITLNISDDGIGFLTEAILTEGQAIIITSPVLPDFAGRKARVVWIKRDVRYFEVGAQFFAAD